VNLFNRFVVVVMLLTTLLVSVFGIFALAFWQDGIFAPVRAVAAAYPPGSGLPVEDLVIGIVAGAVLAVIALVALWFEVVPGAQKGVRLSQVSGSRTIITSDAIVQRARYDAELVEHVKGAKPTVRASGKQVDVRLELRLSPHAEVAPLVEDVARRVREGITQHLGVRLNRLNIVVRQESFSKSKPPAAKPPASTSLTAPAVRSETAL
jgi:uncharacterized alkaline shock family protein YloU